MSVARIDALRTIAAASITGSYTLVGSSIQHNWRIFKIINNTDGDVLISVDSINDNLFFPAGSFGLYDLGSNSDGDSNTGLVLANGTPFFVKLSSAPATTGSLYIEGIYEQGQ